MKRVLKYLPVLCLACVALLFAGYMRASREREQQLQAAAAEIQKEKESLEQQLEGAERQLERAEKDRFRITVTDSGFLRKNGQYLIESQEDLARLAELVGQGEEIEEGVPAARASFRFLQDVDLKQTSFSDFTGIGTREHPFCGVIDGDRHTLTGAFFTDEEKSDGHLIAHGDGCRIVNLSMHNSFRAGFWDEGMLRQLLEAPFTVDIRSGEQELYLSLSDQAGCDGLADFLEKYDQIDSLHLLIGGTVDTGRLAGRLRAMENCRLQIEWQTEEENVRAALQASAKGFFSLPAGLEVPEETASVMEGSRLWRFCRQKVEGLTCTSFLFEGWGREDCAPILLLAEGAWEGEDDICQLVVIPAPESDFCSEYGIEAEDMDFDGRKDLLLNVGSSGGSGGSWRHYRSAVWKPEAKEFSFFASMPEQVYYFDREGKRMIYKGRCGAGDETVTAYEVINGEYRETRSLNLVTWEEPVLYHYEKGELVEELKVSGVEEVIERFPDMAYWSKG